MGGFKKWGDPSNAGDDFEMGGGGWYPFTDYASLTPGLMTDEITTSNKSFIPLTGKPLTFTRVKGY